MHTIGGEKVVIQTLKEKNKITTKDLITKEILNLSKIKLKNKINIEICIPEIANK